MRYQFLTGTSALQMLSRSPPSLAPEASRSPGWWRWGGGEGLCEGLRGCRPLVAGLLCGWAVQAGATHAAPLLLVQPMERTPVGNAVAQHFARWLPYYLDEKAVLHRPSNGLGLEAIAWAAQSAPADRTVLMLSQLWLNRLDALPASAPGARGWVPLQIVWQGTWCLMGPEARALPDYPALNAWLQTLRRPVRLAVPHSFGLPDLWTQAMARKTGLPWQNQAFGTARQAVQALAAGNVDLVLDRCGDTAQYLDGQSERARTGLLGVQVLARVGMPAPLRAPTFAQWQLPPITPGWAGWFAPPGMSPERQAQLGKALHAIALRDDTQALIAQQQQQPVRMSVADSQRFVRRTQTEGQSLRLWLERLADPVLDLGEPVP